MRILSIALLLYCSIACASLAADHDEHEIPLSEVPAAARAAAAHAVPGIRLTGAEVEREHGRLVYEIEGIADGKEYEIEVTAEGEVLEIEVEDEHDDEDDD